VTRKLTAILYADVAGYSQLTEADEVGTHRQLSSGLDLIAAQIKSAGGRVVHYAGDAVLAEFASVATAVDTAVQIQRTVAEESADIPETQRLLFRIGVNLGEVIVDRDDIYGDGVNIAARLESLAEPGGIWVSDDVFRQVNGKVQCSFEDMGPQVVKNIAQPVQAYRVAGFGKKEPQDTERRREPELRQRVNFCMTSDGVSLAYSMIGNGPVLVKGSTWLSHLEYDFQSAIWQPWIRLLSAENTLVRYDARGIGLSDCEVEKLSFDGFVHDLETVIEAAGLQEFALMGISQSCPVVLAYAAHHPERVTKLVLYSGYSRGRLRRGKGKAMEEEVNAITTLMRLGWGRSNPEFQRLFSAQMVPSGNEEHIEWWNELQRRSTTPENAARIREIADSIDVSDLAAQLSIPTLVINRRDDATGNFEDGRRTAALIPNSRFVVLEGNTHIILDSEDEWTRFASEIQEFLRS
jgi:class 3 adenylate cyclase/pimeloyl-ACP methyl ester carboxylesterase